MEPPTFQRVDGWQNVYGYFSKEDAQLYQRWAEQVPNGATIVELGTFYGRSAAKLLQALTILGKFKVNIVCVDVFAIPAQLHTTATNLQPFIDSFVADAANKGVVLRQPPLRYIQFDSRRSAELFDKESVWGVFIDTVHRYSFLNSEIEAWWDKLKVGGEMGFHDYCPTWEGVVQAIDEKFAKRLVHRSGVCVSVRKTQHFDGKVYL